MKPSGQDSSNALFIIHGSGLRPTAARVSVLSVLLSARHALTHSEVEKAVATHDGAIERVTLYRVLDWLVNQGLAHKITGQDRVWRFNAQAYPVPHHPHFTCTGCHQVFCLEDLGLALTGTPPSGFHLTQTDVSLQGTCPHCSP